MTEINQILPDPEPSTGRTTEGFSRLNGQKVIEKDENSVTLEFSIPDTSPYFDGHFPGFPLLPAVAQIEMVLRFASLYLGTGIDVSEIPRIKCTNIIRPFTPLLLKIEKKNKNISFKTTSPDGITVYSLGTLEIRENFIPPESGLQKECL